MGDYHDHYLNNDVLLLAVFERFIDACFKILWIRSLSLF